GMGRSRPLYIYSRPSAGGAPAPRRPAARTTIPISGAVSAPSLLDPGPRQGRRAVAIGAAKRAGGHIAHVGLEDQEAVVVRHPHPQHLVELSIDDLLGDRPLLGAIGCPAQLRRQIV